MNEHILEQCMHREFKVIRDRHSLFTACLGCMVMMDLQGRPSNAEVQQLWLKQQIRPAHNSVNAGQVERWLIRKGWTVMLFQRDGCSFRCVASRAGQRMQSDVCRSRYEAIVQLAARVVRKCGIVRPID